MSENVSPTNNPGVDAMTATNATSQAAAVEAMQAGGGGGAGGFSSMADLKERAPEVYKAITEAIVSTICNSSKRSTDRINDILRENKDPA